MNLLLFNPSNPAQPELNSIKIAVEFHWYRDYEKPKRVNGVIYFPTKNGYFLLKTTAGDQPQIILWQPTKMVVFYPESNKGVSINASFPLTMPPIQGLLFYSTISSMLPEEAFSLKDVKTTEKGTLSIYEPKPPYDKIYKKVKIVKEGTLVKEFTITTPKQIVSIEAKGILKLKKTNIPQKIVRKTFQKAMFSKKLTSTDIIEYSNLTDKIPEKWAEFKIPEDAEIKKVQW